MRALMGSVVLVALAIGVADAQICTGNASFANGNFRVGGAAQFSDGVQGFGGNFVAGSPAAFGSFSVGSLSYDDVDGSSLLVGGGAGYQMAVGSTGNVQLCPVASVDFAFGPNDIEGTGIDASGRSFSFGGMIGGVLSSSPQFQVVPAGGLAFAHSTVKLDDGVDSISESDTFGLGMFAVGFVINNSLTIQPGLSIPFGLDESDPTYGVLLSLNFGRR